MDFTLRENNPFAEEITAACADQKQAGNLHSLSAMVMEKTGVMKVLEVSQEFIDFALTDDDENLDQFEKECNLNVDLYVEPTSEFYKSPCTPGTSLNDFRTRLTKVDEYIYKKITNAGFGPVLDLKEYKVVYDYALWAGSNQTSFDSFEKCGRYGVVHLDKEIETFTGIMDALATMKYREESVFWLSWEVMYGALGILIRVPPKCDIVARMRIIKLFDNEGNEIKFDMTPFEKTAKQVDSGIVNARVQFRGKNYNAAANIYRKLIEKLESTRLTNEAEEKQMKEYLIKMYLELALCHNKTGNPQKTCLAIRELERLQSIAGNVKALYAKGKALMMLHDLMAARNLFYRALNLEPSSKTIKDTIEEVERTITEKSQYAAERDAKEKQRDREIAEEPSANTKFVIDKFFKSMTFDK